MTVENRTVKTEELLEKLIEDNKYNSDYCSSKAQFSFKHQLIYLKDYINIPDEYKELLIFQDDAKKITQQEVLTKIAMNSLINPNIRIMAINKIKSQEVLKYIAGTKLNPKSEYITVYEQFNIRSFAINSITDHTFLADLIFQLSKEDSEMIYYYGHYNAMIRQIYRKIDYSHVFVEITEKDRTHKKPLMDIYDEELLMEFVQNHNNWLVRLVAIKKLNNIEKIQEFLYKCYKKERDIDVINAIILKITDEDILFEILKNDYNANSVRCTIATRIKSQKLLIDFATHPSEDEIDLENQFKHLSFFMNPKEHEYYDNIIYPRMIAVSKITDKKVLEQIYSNDKSERVRLAALKNPNFTKQEILKEIIKKDDNFKESMVAIEKIDNQEDLMEFAQMDINYKIRRNAIKQIKDRKTREQMKRKYDL